MGIVQGALQNCSPEAQIWISNLCKAAAEAWLPVFCVEGAKGVGDSGFGASLDFFRSGDLSCFLLEDEGALLDLLDFFAVDSADDRVCLSGAGDETLCFWLFRTPLRFFLFAREPPAMMYVSQRVGASGDVRKWINSCEAAGCGCWRGGGWMKAFGTLIFYEVRYVETILKFGCVIFFDVFFWLICSEL